jgi:N-acetylglucosamine-6-phosphate deacetylase
MNMTQSDENIEKALKNIVACYENQTLGEAAEIGGVQCCCTFRQ